MKSMLSLFGALLIGCAQIIVAQAKESLATIDNKKQPVITLEVEAPVKQVRSAWEQNELWKNLDSRKQQSFHSYRLVPMPAWGGDTLNVYTRVQRLGPHKTIIYVAASRPDGSFISTKTDSVMASRIKKSLYAFISQQNFPSLDFDIYRYSDSVEMDEADYRTYLSEKKKIEMQHNRLANKMNDLERKYEKEKTAWQWRKQRLDELKKSRDLSKD